MLPAWVYYYLSLMCDKLIYKDIRIYILLLCTAKAFWPNRSLAVTVDLDQKGYRMFVKRRNGSVCATFDGRG